MKPQREIKPGDWVIVLENGNCLKEGNEAIIFMIERGTDPIQFGLYSYTKDCWELMERGQFV